MNGQNPVFIPGPTNIPDRLRLAMAAQTWDHRAPDFVDVFHPILEDAKQVFGTTKGKVITFPASGTGGWEAAVTNCLNPGDTVLISRYGMFSHKWILLCQDHGLNVEIIEAEWGEGAQADRFEAALTADKSHRIKAVLATHNETATGVRSDIGAIRAAMDASDHPAMLFVDGVSSIGSMPFEMDAWGVDVAVAGSQKGFMLPTGMAICGVSEKALAACDAAACTRSFFDFKQMAAANAGGGYPYTPPVNLLLGLRESLDMLTAEGLDNVYARHARLAEGVRRAVGAWGMSLVAKRPELYSETVSAIYVPEGFDSNALTNHAYDTYGVSFGVGLGEMAGKAFRIGHLGSLTPTMALSGLATIEMCMADLNYPIELGAGVAAAQEYYRTGAPLAMAAE